MITFAEIVNKILKAGGLSAPKVMEVRASNGENYKLIFKATLYLTIKRITHKVL
jgi:hypothetical protein